MALVGGLDSSSGLSPPEIQEDESKLARHLMDRKKSHEQFSLWCHEIGFECDSKVFQKVIADFFNRPWDGLQFAGGHKQTELPLEEHDSPGRKTTQTKLPTGRTKRNSVDATAGQSPPKRPRVEVAVELRSAPVSWSATAERSIAIFEPPEIPKQIILEIPCVRGSVLDEHIESGLTEVDGLITQLKQFRLSVSGTSRIVLAHPDRGGGVIYKREAVTQHLVPGFITAHLLLRREANDSCLLWLATASSPPDAAPAVEGIELDDLRVGAKVTGPVFVELSMVNLTTSEVVVDALRCPGSSPVVVFACAEIDPNNQVALALATNGVAHLVRLSNSEWELVGSIDVASTLVDTPIQELPAPTLYLAAHKLSPAAVFVFMAAAFPQSDKKWAQQAWTLLATPQNDIESRSGGSFLETSLTMPESDSLFIKQSQWDVSHTAHLLPLVVKDTFKNPLDDLSSGDLALLADAAASFSAQQSFLLLSRLVVESVCLPFEASGGNIEESGQLKRMYVEDFLPAWAAQYMSAAAITPSPLAPGDDGVSSPSAMSRRSVRRRLTNPLDNRAVRPMLQPELLRKMDTGLSQLFFRLWLPVVASGGGEEPQDPVAVCEALVTLVDEQIAGQANAPAERLAQLARQAQTLVVTHRMLEVSREPGMEGIQAFLFLHTIEMLIQVSARLLKRL